MPATPSMSLMIRAFTGVLVARTGRAGRCAVRWTLGERVSRHHRGPGRESPAHAGGALTGAPSGSGYRLRAVVLSQPEDERLERPLRLRERRLRVVDQLLDLPDLLLQAL